MIRVMVCGGFDPLHIGHLEHIRLAKQLGSYLIVAINSDSDMVRKKGYYFIPFEERKEIVKAIRYVDCIIDVIDNDGTVTQTLKMVRPDIFAKGGDRTPNNMPQSEIDICKRLGIKIVYGVGRQLNSSSELVRRLTKSKI